MPLYAILLLVVSGVFTLCNGLQNSPQVPIVDAKHPPKRVAIIGAGAAGSSSAYHLARYARDAAIPILINVYERSDYIGGRSTTVPVYDSESLGFNVELGASIFVKVNRILVEAVEEFNLTVDGFSRSQGEEAEDFDATQKKELLGIWNGESFVFTQTISSVSWWRDLWMKGKLLWRYGMAPLKTVRLMQNVTGRFFDMYAEPIFPWKSGLSDAVEAAGLLSATAMTGSQFIAFNGIGELFGREIIQASTRVNYAQNLGLIHGLETMVCMATDGAMSVKGGNWQIFSHMLNASSSTIRLSTDVFGVHKHANASYTVSSTTYSSSTLTNETFDAVILAAPFHQSDIHFSSSHGSGEIPTKESTPSNVPYVNLHVTLFTSPFLLSPSAFDLDPSSETPDVILTTLKASEQAKLGQTMNGTNVGSSGFYSISILRTVMNQAMSPPRLEYVYKIFSPERISDDFLWNILHVTTGTDRLDHEDLKKRSPNEHRETAKTSTPENPTQNPAEPAPAKTSGVQQTAIALLRNIHATVQPIINPLFDPLSSLLQHLPFSTQLKNKKTTSTQPPPTHHPKNKDTNRAEHPNASITWIKRHVWKSYPYLPPRVTFDAHKLDGDNESKGGLWYTSGIENFISTMETSALMGKNLARLMVDEWIDSGAKEGAES